MIKAKFIDFKNIRKERQIYNNDLIYKSIKESNIDELIKLSNKNELDRVLEDTNLNINELVSLCSNNDIMNKILSGRISKNSSRQSNIDEIIQINTINELSINYNIYIEKLNIIDYIPMEDGLIISKKYKKYIKNKCLKSFDAKISGLINGFMFAKIVYGCGGHQDNVFDEANNLCEWIVKFHKNTDIIFVLIIDTDLLVKFDKLKFNFKDIKNIIISNHIDFQNYIISNYPINIRIS
jgi:PIN domain nuclease of toxin-antitoxin system